MIDWLLWGAGFLAGLSVGWSIWWLLPYRRSEQRRQRNLREILDYGIEGAAERSRTRLAR